MENVSIQQQFFQLIRQQLPGHESLVIQVSELLNLSRLTFVTYNVLHYMHTSDQRFTKKAFENFELLISRSTLISATGEKDRNKFFQLLRDKVEACR
jgi:hypothetical protein